MSFLMGGNSTQNNFCLQEAELNALSVGYCPPNWYMIEAVQAHENVHQQHIQPSLSTVLPNIPALFTSLSVPNTGQTEEQAINQIMALSDYQTALDNTLQTWLTEYHSEDANDHNGATQAAEHTVVDPMVIAICNYAKSLNWLDGANYCPLCN